MFQPIHVSPMTWRERIRSGLGRRAAGIVLTLIVEALLVFALFTLGVSPVRRKEVDMTLSTFDVAAQPEPEAAAPQSPAAEPEPAERPREQSAEPVQPPERPQPVIPAPTIAPPPWIPLTREQLAVADTAIKRPKPAERAAPAKPQGSVMGPVDTRKASGDSQRVGTAPNGEPLYAASWYREPYPDELRGYLSTASGPGWGLIACRTVANYRVEDCEALGEYPEGSNIARAVLAAAWQFRVRPPQVGGRPQIGEWVRIRIDYSTRRQ